MYYNLGYCEVKGKHPISVYAFLKRQETRISGIYGEHGHMGMCFSQFASCESITKYVCNTNVSLHTYLHLVYTVAWLACSVVSHVSYCNNIITNHIRDISTIS